VVTFAATTVQTTAARFIAIAGDAEDAAGLHRWLARSVRPAALAVAGLLVVTAPVLAGAFQLTSPLPLVVFACGIPLYLSQSVHRGVIQGEAGFVALAGSYQAEMWARLVGGVVLVSLGWSVAGAAGALTLSFGAGWLVARRPLVGSRPIDEGSRREVRSFAGKTSLLLLGEILICHSDLIIAKLVLAPAAAGSYAAVSLIGRAAVFGTWPVVAYMIPVAARRHGAGRPPGRLLAGALAIVGGLSMVMAIGAIAAPELILELTLGPEYRSAAPWLAPYVVASGSFALAKTVFSYHLARGVTTGAFLAIGAGVTQVIALALFHGSALTMVWAQLGLMAGLLIVTAAWHFGPAGRARPLQTTTERNRHAV
jgi:O-antigen/teichoic acid export membrane protein